MTRLQSVTLRRLRGRQNPVDTAYDVGSVVSVLADVGYSSSQLLVSRLLMVSLDGTGCLEGVLAHSSMRNVTAKYLGNFARRVVKSRESGLLTIIE
ncbi:hypothetical protein TNCV_2331351 [Trichonephila clavipes]|nr:hypothetical protein TNCV_2331351 [Trichonephila clavipes]